MRNIILLGAVGAALALTPAAALASGHHSMMKKSHKAKKGTPMQDAGTVGEKSGGSNNGPNTNNMGTGGK